MFRLHLLLLLVLGFCSIAVAQSQLPLCAQLCLKDAFATDICTPSDRACICTNASFQHTVTKCVASTCTIIEGLATRNISLTSCGTPIHNRGPEHIVLSEVMICVAAIFVVIRFAYKATVPQMDFQNDDWCILATLMVAISATVVTIYGTVKNGLDRDIWALTPQQITGMLKYFYVMASLYFTQTALLKLSLLFFYIRVFPGKEVRRLLWSLVLLVAMWAVAFLTVAIFQCRPIHYFWTKWDGQHDGTCLDINAIAASHAAMSIILDFCILGIPLWQLWGLKMDWKKKIGVALMFCIGTFVTVVSILRLQALVQFASVSNASWGFYDISVWSTIEVSVGIVCACLPTVRLLLVRLFPVLGGSSNQYKRPCCNYGSGHELNDVERGNKTSKHDDIVAVDSQSAVSDRNRDIRVKTSFTVQHGSWYMDDARLIGPEEKITA